MQRGETVLAFFSVVAISTNPSTVNNGANVRKKSEGQKVEGLKVMKFSKEDHLRRFIFCIINCNSVMLLTIALRVAHRVL
jgi:hypothetical protein